MPEQTYNLSKLYSWAKSLKFPSSWVEKSFAFTPKGLIATQTLDFYNNPTSILPPLVSIQGSLYLTHSPITALPPTLKLVKGSLDLAYTSLTTLPPNLTITSDLILSCTPLTTLPTTLKLHRGLYLGKCHSLPPKQIYTYLKNNPLISDNLDLSYTSLTSLPPNLTIGGSLDLSHTPLDSLPSSLTIKLDLILENCPALRSIPPSIPDEKIKGLTPEQIATLKAAHPTQP